MVVGLQGRAKSVMISLSVLIQYRRVTDTRRQQRQRVRMASRG